MSCQQVSPWSDTWEKPWGLGQKVYFISWFQRFPSRTLSSVMSMLTVGQMSWWWGHSLMLVRKQRCSRLDSVWRHDHRDPPQLPKPYGLKFLEPPVMVSLGKDHTFSTEESFAGKGYFFLNLNEVEHQESPKSPYFWNPKLRPDLILKKSFSLGTIWVLLLLLCFAGLFVCFN